MPIYEYRCTGCGVKMERLYGVKEDKPAPQCECGGSTVRVLSAGVIRMGELQRHPNHPDMVEEANAQRRERRKVNEAS